MTVSKAYVLSRANRFTAEGDFIHLNSLKTRCPQGHPYDDKNTLISKTRGKIRRHCRTCMRSSHKLYMRARRSADLMSPEVQDALNGRKA